MSSTECRICFLAFDPKRVPKNLACGHYFCLLCLKNEKASKGCLRCFTCRSVVHVAPDQLVTNFNILSDASSKSEFHCIDCNQEATFTCEKNGHIFKSLAAHKCKQTKSCHEKALEEDKSLRNHETIVNQISKQMNNVLQTLLLKSHERRSKNKVFLKKIDDYARGDIRLQEVLCEEETCKASILSLERDLQLLQLNKGLCNISLTSEGSARTATLDLASLATTSPEVLAVIRSLFFLLERDSLLISKQSCNQASRPLNSHAPSQDNTRKGDPEKHAQASVSEQSDDGVLDLEIGQIGFAGPRQMLEEKDTILKCTKIVTELKGLKCDSDPMFSTRLIQKHAPHLESLTLHTIQQEQFNLLASLRSLKHLKLVGHSGRLTARLPLQPDCQLRSLYMTLPIPVQMSLWEAFSPSVVNVTMRIEVASSVDVHLILSRPVKKSTHLRTLHLHRKCVDQHNADECGRQKHLIRRVLPEHVRLSCNMCGVGDGMH